MNLISQWYSPESSKRRGELSEARRRNAGSGLFASITYLNGDERRLTYRDLFTEAARRFPGELCVVANTDIAFDETARAIPGLIRKNRIIALTRWESPSSPRMIGHLVDERFFSGSQDSWAFIAGSIPELALDIPTGEQGCEQALLGWAVQSGIEIISPSLDIKTWHIHEDRNEYNRSVTGKYAYPEMTTRNFGMGLVCTHQYPFETNASGNVDVEFVYTCP